MKGKFKINWKRDLLISLILAIILVAIIYFTSEPVCQAFTEQGKGCPTKEDYIAPLMIYVFPIIFVVFLVLTLLAEYLLFKIKK